MHRVGTGRDALVARGPFARVRPVNLVGFGRVGRSTSRPEAWAWCEPLELGDVLRSQLVDRSHTDQSHRAPDLLGEDRDRALGSGAASPPVERNEETRTSRTRSFRRDVAHTPARRARCCGQGSTGGRRRRHRRACAASRDWPLAGHRPGDAACAYANVHFLTAGAPSTTGRRGSRSTAAAAAP